MNDEERISTLEADLASLRSALGTAEPVRQYLAGERRVYEASILALVLSHPRPDLLAPVLEDHLLRVEAGVAALSSVEEHLEGVHAAQKSLRQALAAALGRGGA